ncbi:uncharacterized protein LOC129317690 [Prosopis cineraria]|uniref:uncharacterized protein LOC129317690 n=1 Tax=Prosopis cineraria TaxID=364024 RepID=UPI00240EE0FC|nr:uncharacterized protein LOC129317690 [Prosopis cineraria]
MLWKYRNIQNMQGVTVFQLWRSQLVLLFTPCFDKGKLQFSFHVGTYGSYRGRRRVKIRKYGWRVVCKEDVEALQRTSGEGCRNNGSDNYHSLHETPNIEINHSRTAGSYIGLSILEQSHLIQRLCAMSLSGATSNSSRESFSRKMKRETDDAEHECDDR